MKFYDALQLDPSVLKKKIAQCETRREKNSYWSVMVVRALLIVSFSIVFIGSLSGLFGADNTPMAVALFCIMLGIRFVNFEYCIRDSLVTLAASFTLLLLVPAVVAVVPPLAMLPIHFLAFFILMYMTSQRPELGNGGLYNFAYIYLVGNPVYGEALGRRALLTLVGYLICGTILFIKHRDQHTSVRFFHVMMKFDLKNLAHLWQLRIAIGVSLVLTAGQFFGVQRFMWMGFACASLLSEYPYSGNTSTRFWQRIVGVLVGSGAFFILFQLMPEALRPLIGPLGGLCLGFCTDYRYKTAMNCLGALMLGAGIYGLQGAVVLRIADTILGVLFGMAFAWVFHKLIAVRFLPKPQEEAVYQETERKVVGQLRHSS